MPTAKVTKNVSAAIGGGNVLCSTLISIKTKAWLYSFHQQVVFDECLMRVQTFIYQYGYMLIHHFIKIIRVLSTVLLLRYRTVLSSVWENSDTLGYSPLDRWCK